MTCSQNVSGNENGKDFPEKGKNFPSELMAIVNEQAEDDGLWFLNPLCSEAYLQAALRRLHAAIEAYAMTSQNGVTP